MKLMPFSHFYWEEKMRKEKKSCKMFLTNLKNCAKMRSRKKQSRESGKRVGCINGTKRRHSVVSNASNKLCPKALFATGTYEEPLYPRGTDNPAQKATDLNVVTDEQTLPRRRRFSPNLFSTFVPFTRAHYSDNCKGLCTRRG